MLGINILHGPIQMSIFHIFILDISFLLLLCAEILASLDESPITMLYEDKKK